MKGEETTGEGATGEGTNGEGRSGADAETKGDGGPVCCEMSAGAWYRMFWLGCASGLPRTVREPDVVELLASGISTTFHNRNCGANTRSANAAT